jgi:CHASE3 domain sensor protein
MAVTVQQVAAVVAVQEIVVPPQQCRQQYRAIREEVQTLVQVVNQIIQQQVVAAQEALAFLHLVLPAVTAVLDYHLAYLA